MHGLCPLNAGNVPPNTHTHTHIEKKGGGYRNNAQAGTMKEILSGKTDIYFHVKLWLQRCRGVPQNQSSTSRRRSCRSQLVEWQLKAEHVVWINTFPRVQPNSGGRQDLRLPCDDRHIRLIIVLLLTHITFTCTVEFPHFFLFVLQKI